MRTAMIGVALDPGTLAVAREFFELFKTPWEPAVPGKTYAVAISAGGSRSDVDADVTIIYSPRTEDMDRALGIDTERHSAPVDLVWDGTAIPIYTRMVSFAGVLETRLTANGKAVAYRQRLNGRTVHRIGYDLFAETAHLLTAGQPVSHAETPTLELHIAFLRSVLVDAGVPFVEIPPRPQGYDFTCCLTHDIDFYGIRRHALDRTLAGFVARASIGTLIDLCLGRRSFVDAARNWAALASLPLVLTGLLPD